MSKASKFQDLLVMNLCWSRTSVEEISGAIMNEHEKEEERQAVTKDLTSSSKFSGSCVLTLQTLPRIEKDSLYGSVEEE